MSTSSSVCNTDTKLYTQIMSEGIEAVVAFAQRREVARPCESWAIPRDATVREVLASIDHTLVDKLRYRIADFKEQDSHRCCWNKKQLDSLANSVLDARSVPWDAESFRIQILRPTFKKPTILLRDSLPRPGQVVTDKDEETIGVLWYFKRECVRTTCTSRAFQDGQSLVPIRRNGIQGWAHPRTDDESVPPEPIVSFGPCQSCKQPMASFQPCMASILGQNQVEIVFDDEGWGYGCKGPDESEPYASENTRTEGIDSGVSAGEES